MNRSTKSEVGQRLANLRTAAGYSQEELAEALTRAGWPVTKTGLSTYERGRTLPPVNNPEFSAILARVLNIPPKTLYAMLGMFDLNSDTLTPTEIELVRAFRSKNLHEVIKRAADMTDS